MTTDRTSGWEFIANESEGATVVSGLLSLDPETTYTRSELAEAADVPLKTLYLVDTLDHLETAGMLTRVDDVEAESEACFVVNEESDVYQAALEFDATLGAALDGVSADESP